MPPPLGNGEEVQRGRRPAVVFFSYGYPSACCNNCRCPSDRPGQTCFPALSLLSKYSLTRTATRPINPSSRILLHWRVGHHHLPSLPAKAPLVRATANGRPRGRILLRSSDLFRPIYRAGIGKVRFRQPTFQRLFLGSRFHPPSTGRPKDRSRWGNAQGVAFMNAATFNGTFNRFDPCGRCSARMRLADTSARSLATGHVSRRLEKHPERNDLGNVASSSPLSSGLRRSGRP